MGAGMRLRALRMVDADHAVMEFMSAEGAIRTFEITYGPVPGRPGETTYRVEPAFEPWMQVDLRGWPGGIDHRTFTDMVMAFHSMALADWASDDTLRLLADRRRAELDGT